MFKNNSPEIKATVAIFSASFGSLALGIFIVLAEYSTQIKNFLNLYDPVGPLSGKTTFAALAFFAMWLILSSVDLSKTSINNILKLSFVFLGIALLLNFPPIFYLFASH